MPGFSGGSTGSSGWDSPSVARQLIDNYVYLSAEVVVPANLISDLAAADDVNKLLIRGLVVKEGVNFVSRATYSRRQIFINGQTLQ